MPPTLALLAALAATAVGAPLLCGRADAQPPRPRPAPAPAPAPREPDAERDVVVEMDAPDDLFVRRFGALRRGTLGVRLAAGGAGDTLGVRVGEVVPGGPAARAGIVAGDRIVAIDEREVRLARGDADDPEVAELGARRVQEALRDVRPGDTVEVELRRGRELRTVRVRAGAPAWLADGDAPLRRRGAMPGERIGPWAMDTTARRDWEQRARAWRDSARARAERRPALGLSLQSTGAARDSLGLFVAAVTTGGPAEQAGIVEGDRIASIDGVDVRVPREELDDDAAGRARAARFTRELLRRAPGDQVTLRVWSGGALRTVTARLGRATEVYRDGEGIAFGFAGPDGAPIPPLPPIGRFAPPGGGVQIWRFDGPEDAAIERPRTPRPPRPPRPPVRLERRGLTI